ncbi:hypothetical protein [Flavobacterium selenitireducens]|uniref:hypothetical protein n=1 Tax=Flavobacterium selenitireducens TaxID=2722704 RepID=UPI00168B3EFF|nr:hypothetical protein [Flavobacterium selenitireducens]MBD3582598.1 hypothetical protein [Flavobacterium selenitireducens]
MKHIKILAAVALFFAINAVSAQTAKTNWPKLNDVKEVAARINTNLEQNNAAAFSFASTLAQQVEQLKTSEAPANFKNKKTQDAINQLSAKADALNKKALAKAPESELRKQFSEIQTILASMTDEKTKK